MSGQRATSPPLIDETSIEWLVGIVNGLQVEIREFRKRAENYERCALILEYVRRKLHADGILVPEDMEGIEEKFEHIPHDLRKMEADPAKFLSALPKVEHKSDV